MNRFCYTRSLALLIFFGLFSSPAHAIFKSLSLWTWNPDGKKSIEIFIMGDVHIGGGNPNEKNSLHDAKNYELLKNALSEWNTLGSLTCLIESNEFFIKENEKEDKKQKKNWNSQLPLPYWGIYYTLPNYIKTNGKTTLSNIKFSMCDMRYKAYYETKKAILILREMFAKLDVFLKDNNKNWIDKNALQKNMNSRLLKSSKVSAKKFLDELRQGSNIIKKALKSKDDSVDKITHDTLENYSKNLIEGIDILKKFFNEQLNNKLDKSTLEALINNITNEVELDKKDQTDRSVALSCIKECRQLINDFNTQYEKITNYTADAGFILTLLKQKQSHKNLVIFCGNNHAVALSEYLKQYKKAGKARCHFAKSFLKYNYGSSSNNEKISPIQAQRLFCIPFNKTFENINISALATTPIKLTKTTRSYICANCPKISIDNKFLQCSKCKAVNYCSITCQRGDWKKHKLTCIQP